MDIQGLIKAWLDDNKHIVSIRAIEKDLGIPADTLQKVVQGSRKLPNKWIIPLLKYLDDFADSWAFPSRKYKEFLQYEPGEKINWDHSRDEINKEKRKRRNDHIPEFDRLVLIPALDASSELVPILRNLIKLSKELEDGSMFVTADKLLRVQVTASFEGLHEILSEILKLN